MVEQLPVDEAGEPRRYLPDGRPVATRRKKKAPGAASSGNHVAEFVTLRVAPGERVIVIGDLRLNRGESRSQVALSAELARVFEMLEGPCSVIVAGNLFDPGEAGRFEAEAVLTAHLRLAEALAATAARDRCRVVVCPGDLDAGLSDDPRACAVVERRLGAELAGAVDLVVTTGTGEHRVRVESKGRDHGSPAVLGGESGAQQHPEQDWLRGLDLVPDAAAGRAFTASRLFYRRIAQRLSWTLLPVVAAIPVLLVGKLLRVRGHVATGRTLDAWAAFLALGGLALVVAAAVVAVIWWSSLRRRISFGAMESPPRPAIDEGLDNQTHMRAGQFVLEGSSGLVASSGADAELWSLGRGFFANAGCCRAVATRRPGRLGAPDAFTVEQRWSWLELEAGADLHVRLHLARRQLLATTFIERLFTQAVGPPSAAPQVVATWPDGQDWPGPPPSGSPERRARRGAAILIAAAGLINLVSAVLPPLRDRLVAVRDVVPLAIAQAAAMVVALAGLLLLLLARGIRRGQRHAWVVAEVVLVASMALHLVKGLDFEEALIAGAVALYLAANRRHFRVPADDVPVGRGLAVLAGGAAVAVAAAVAAIKLTPGHRHPGLSWTRATQAVVERLVGVTNVPLGAHLDRFLVPVMMTVAVGLVLYAGWLVFSPVLTHRLGDREADDVVRARAIVAGSPGGTLAYFALRDDKRWFFSGDSLVAYAVTQGVALVSPDPIGPAAERRRAWSAFRRYADDRGWAVAVMGATEEWLPIYRASGMRELYIGDEAVVDVQRFSLEGPRNKAVRQAVNRVANKGYEIEFCDPACLAPEVEVQLRALMTESRRGEMERGFSMTLGRVFDARDTGLLLAVCRGSDGVPAAFCQYVPAPGIDGFSLDLMRRSERDDHPNGLTDFVVAETILHLRELGLGGLGLNFATMRSIIAGERGDDTTRRVQRWFYQKMSDSMQIESLWRYNAKFDPQWVPRYACYDSAEHMLSSATAVAKAESWWEIPVVGRFFRPTEVDSAEDPEPLIQA